MKLLSFDFGFVLVSRVGIVLVGPRIVIATDFILLFMFEEKFLLSVELPPGRV